MPRKTIGLICMIGLTIVVTAILTLGMQQKANADGFDPRLCPRSHQPCKTSDFRLCPRSHEPCKGFSSRVVVMRKVRL